MSLRARRKNRIRREAVALLVEQAEDLEAMTPADLRVICLALEDRVAKYPGQPAAEAAMRVREKMERNMTR